MSYTPTEWKTGDVITAEKLNNMESGIANAGGDENTMVFEFSASSNPESPGSLIVTTDATYEEVKTAMTDGKLCVAKLSLYGDINFLIFDYIGLYSIVASYTDMYLSGPGTALGIIRTKLNGTENAGWKLSQSEYEVAIATT